VRSGFTLLEVLLTLSLAGLVLLALASTHAQTLRSLRASDERLKTFFEEEWNEQQIKSSNCKSSTSSRKITFLHCRRTMKPHRSSEQHFLIE
jgi:prepilin-type N-terminal cleavage/methylation domain-containing protein